jgi:hypothetical protein
MLHVCLFPASRRWPLLFTLLTLALLGLPAAPPALAQNDWPAAVRVNTNLAEEANEPSLDIDPQGFAHVAWFGGETDDDWAIYYSNNRNNGIWSPPRLISVGGSSDERKPDIVVAPNGSVHVVWERRESGSDIHYNFSPDFGATWSTPVNVSRQPAPSYEPAIAADANSNVHIAWIDRRFDAANDVTLVVSRIGGNFTPITRLATNDSRAPSIATTGSGTSVQVHVVWYGRPFDDSFNSNYEIWYASGAPGTSYSAQRNLSNDPGLWSLDPSLASDGSKLFLVWDKQIGTQHHVFLMYSENAGASWSEPRDLDPTAVQALFPDVDVGPAGQVHIAWHDNRGTNTREVYYVNYNATTNTFGATVEKVSALGRSSERANVGASTLNGNYGVVWQSFVTESRGAWISLRGGAPPPQPVQGVIAAQEPGNSSSISAQFSQVTGDPTEMRIAFDRAPNDSDAWEPYQQSFSKSIPSATSCNRTIQAQLRNAQNQVSPITLATFKYDTSVQAIVKIQNPNYTANEDDFVLPSVQDVASEGAVNGHPFYTRNRLFYLEVNNYGECSNLGNATVTGFSSTYAVPNGGYAGLLPLPGDGSDGPREVSVKVTDSVGNEMVVTQEMTLDRTPPQFGSGALAVPDIPSTGALSAFVRLEFSNVVVSDNLYPGGFWGIWVANTLDSSLADNDARLDWRPIAAPQGAGASFTISRWNLLTGLGRSLDNLPFGQDIQVRVRFLDGAGNPTAADSLKATVRLASNAPRPSVYLPLLRR